MMIATLEKQLIQEYSKFVVRQEAPEEILFFDELFEKHQKTGGTDYMLGSGIDQTVELMSPAIIAAVSSVLTYVFRELVKSIKDKSKETIKQEIGQIFSRKSSSDSTLSSKQLRLIKLVAYKQLKDFGWGDTKARRVANAIVGALATKNVGK